MIGGRGLSPAALCFLLHISVVQAADDNAGVIAASAVAAFLVLVAFTAITIYCFYKRKGFKTEHTKKRHKRVVHVPNGVPPQKKHRKHHHHHPRHYRQNDKVQPNGIPHIPVQPVVRPYNTYHGPPPQYYPEPPPMKHGTFTGPPPVVVIPTPHGTVAMRPDPRPVVHKRDKRYHKSSNDDDQRQHKRSRSQPPPAEYIIEQSRDGIPVIRPVIYIDDDKDKHRSKSRDRKHKSHDRTDGAQITEIKLSDTEAVANLVQEVEVHEQERSRSRSRSRTPPRTRTPPSRLSPDRSRASSVTEAVNALRMSIRQHGSKDIDTDTASELGLDSPIPFGSQEHRAPDPVAGDVLFFPAGAQPPSLRESHAPVVDTTEQVYSYTKVIKSNNDEEVTEETGETQVKISPTPLRTTKVKLDDTEVSRSSVKANYLGTRDEEPKPYETEHTVQTNSYIYKGDMRTSMSDRLTSLVEDGDKTRFSHYNVGAVTLGDETEEDNEPEVQMRPKRPPTPPNDIRSSIYSRPLRPSTPPNDIPLISPRESSEIPRLDLQSSSATPRVMHLYRPESPPRDFPITPQSSLVRPRPSTPPFDIETHRESMLSSRSEAVNPATGEPGSFQARKRLIEAHLQTQVDPDKSKANVKVNRKSSQAVSYPDPLSNNRVVNDPTPAITVTPGIIPPAPPPPPIK